jgi:glutathione peroxidase
MKSISLLLSVLTVQLAMAATPPPLHNIPIKDIDGKPTSLKPYEGKVLLVVNVASKCGLTPQYKALEELHQKFQSKGLVVLGFPSNDFGNQEPGTNEEIKEFCESNYGVSFPLFDKLHVKGPEQHPLYNALTGPSSPFPGDIQWNFGKFLVGKDGRILARFEPRTTPDSKEVTDAIEKALATKS